MTRSTNARVAGITFLLYVAAGLTGLALGRTPVASLLTLLTSFCALVLGVALYAITRGEDPDIAMLALTCRVAEAVVHPGAIYFAVGSALFSWLFLRGRMIPAALARLGLVASVLLVLILGLDRAGMIRGANNWASAATWIIWLPLLVFEVALALWLLVRGVAAPVAAREE